MTDRLKNTIFCSLLLARKYIIILLAVEIITAALMYACRENYDFAVCTDVLPALLTMLAGMSFFERHNAFCAANAVSSRNRIISAGTVSAAVCLTVSALNCIVWGITDIWTPLTEIIRTVAHMRMVSGGNIFADGTETFFFLEALFFFGCFFGGLRYAVGNALTMAMLAVLAAVSAGSIFLESVMNVTPAMLLLYLPALMQRSVFTAVLLSMIFAAFFLALSVKLSEVTVQKRRGG